MKNVWKVVVGVMVGVVGMVGVSGKVIADTTTLISKPPSGVFGNAGSSDSRISRNGKFVVFNSLASNLVIGDTNGITDILLKDVDSGLIERVNVDTSENQIVSGYNYVGGVSDDGRFVVFISSSPSLFEGDTNGLADAFLRDRQNGTTSRIVTSYFGGSPDSSIRDIRISADGRYIVFETSARNIVPNYTNLSGDPYDVYVKNLTTQEVRRVSVASGGGAINGSSLNADISSDGRYIVFQSNSHELAGNNTGSVRVYVHDWVANNTELISKTYFDPNIGANGHNNDPSISPDGRFVSFTSTSTNLLANPVITPRATAYIYDRVLGIMNQEVMYYYTWNGTEWISQPITDGDFRSVSVSDNGRYMAFGFISWSQVAPGTYANSQNVFWRDLQSGETRIVNVDLSGSTEQWRGSTVSNDSFMNGSGDRIIFNSGQNGLVANKYNGIADVYIRNVTLPNSSSVAYAGIDIVSNEGQTLIFNGLGSSDPDGVGDIVSYNWDFGDGTSGSGVGVSHTYADEGVYTATLTVMDTAGHLASDTATVTVNNVAPAVGTLSSIASVLPGITVTTSANFSDPGVNDTQTATFDWGDGNSSVGVVSGGVVSGSHSYTIPGLYTITLTVTDDDGGSGTATTSVTILTPVQATQNLIGLVQTFNLQQGIENSLDAKLDAAVEALNDINANNDVAAVNALQAFMNAVEAQRGSKITDAQADELVVGVNQILSNL